MPLCRLLLGSGVVAILLACGGATTPETAPASSSSTAAPSVGTPLPVEAAALPAPAAAAGRPLYYDRAVTPEDLDERTLREFSLLRNTIFARAGNPFVKPWLNAYFRAQPWYTPAAKIDMSKLTEIDRQNVTIISERENSFSRDHLLSLRDRVVARGQSGQATPEDPIELSLLSEALGEWVGSADVAVADRNPLEDPTTLNQQLVLGQIDEMSRRDLRLLRNTIYARRGRPFKSILLQQYFADKAWYSELADYTDAALNDVDKRNIALVQSMEDRLGGPLTEWDHEREEGWFAGA